MGDEVEHVGGEIGGCVAVSAWMSYLAGWTAWNHVRTVAALLATALLIFSLLTTGAGADR